MCREKGLAQKKTEAKKIVFSSQKCPQIHLEIPCIRFLQGMILHASSSSNTIPERMENSELWNAELKFPAILFDTKHVVV